MNSIELNEKALLTSIASYSRTHKVQVTNIHKSNLDIVESGTPIGLSG